MQQENKQETRTCENGHQGTGVGFDDGCPECEARWKSPQTPDSWSKEVNDLFNFLDKDISDRRGLKYNWGDCLDESIFEEITVKWKTKFAEVLSLAHSSGKREGIEEAITKTGFLRQWLNERTETRLVTDEDLQTFLKLGVKSLLDKDLT